MSEFTTERLLTDVPRRARAKRLRPLVMISVPLVAILFQVYLPRFFQYLGYLELPLLVTVYYALLNRSAIRSLLFGAAIGLGQDSLSHHPLGMFGIVKTLVGYFAAGVSQRFDVDNPFIQFIVSFFFFFFHQFFYWMMSRALLAQQIDFNVQQTLLFGLLNAVVSVPLFILLDKMKE
jgi:rod shape-determining protein MreD